MPGAGFCPVTCKQTYCKKKIVVLYEVTGLNQTSDDKTIYNIKIITIYKGILPGLHIDTLEVPKSNKKHEIELNQKFLFMSSESGLKESALFLTSGCFNRDYSLLSLFETRFLSKKPDEYCNKQENKCHCRTKKCIRKCQGHCKDCDDEETCEEDCKKRCEQFSWWNSHQKKKKKRTFQLSHEL